MTKNTRNKRLKYKHKNTAPQKNLKDLIKHYQEPTLVTGKRPQANIKPMAGFFPISPLVPKGKVSPKQNKTKTVSKGVQKYTMKHQS